MHLTFNPECKGTVSKVVPGWVRVTWRKEAGEPRMRTWYDTLTAVKALKAG